MGVALLPQPVTPSYAQGVARSKSQSVNPGLWDGLRGAWYPQLGITGITLHDVSGRHNHGTLTNMDPASDWVVTEKGWTLDFDGSDDYVAIPSAVLASAQNAVTISGCFYVRSSEDTEILITGNKAGGNAGDWQIGQLNSRAIRFFYDNATSLDTSTSIFALNTWFSLLCTLDAGGATIYRNGINVKSNATAGVVGGNGQQVRIGRQTNDTGELDGRCAMAAIWHRALSANEIRLLHRDPLAPFRRAAMPVVLAPPAGGFARPLIGGSLAHGRSGLVA